MTKKILLDEERSRFSKLLLHWYHSQNTYTIKDLSSELGIPTPSIYDYIKYGRVPDVSKANKIINFIKTHPIETSKEKYTEKIEESEEFEKEEILSQLTELNDILKSLQRSLDTYQKKISSKKKVPSKDDDLTNHTLRFRSAIFSLYSELNWFKNQTKKERDLLRKKISANDIGYLTSLLRALIKSEDAFSDWILATNYQLEMLKWQKQR
jgi:hypothetical protein